MATKKIKKRNKWNVLAPYPLSDESQDILVQKAEKFTNIMVTVTNALGYFFSLISSLFSKLFGNRDWSKREQAVPADDKEQPIEEAIYVADETHAMNQNFYFSLKKGRIWYKPIAAPKQSAWKLFGPDGLPPPGDKKLVALSSDGVNVIAIDESRTVHYVHTDAINFVVTDNDWIIKSIDLDWTDHWFSIPLVGTIAGLLRGNHQLKLPEDCHTFAISQKGPETGYYTDMNGKNQPDFLVGVTTLYSLSANGRIFFADPWLGNGFGNEITGPEDGQFIAENMAAAASTLFLFRKDKTGQPCMYTRFADFDSIGSNPVLPVTFDSDNQTAFVRRVPSEDWLKQPTIKLEGEAKLSSRIAIIQTGRGQSNRQLRVEGTDSKGNTGYYFKAIYEKNWHFESTNGVIFEHNINKPPHQAPPLPPADLRGVSSVATEELPIKSVDIKKFLHHGFNERGLHTIMQLTLNDGQILKFPLYAYRGLSHFLGLRGKEPYWELIMPQEYRQNLTPSVQAVLNSIFENKTHVPVTLKEFDNGSVELIISTNDFKIEFNPVEPKQSKRELSREKTEYDRLRKSRKHDVSPTYNECKQTLFQHTGPLDGQEDSALIKEQNKSQAKSP